MAQKIIPSNTPIRFRYLRITWTVFCGIACVLLIVLWVRSYWWTDLIFEEVVVPQTRFRSQTISLSNGFGVLAIARQLGGLWPPRHGWQHITSKVTAADDKWKQSIVRSSFIWENSAIGFHIRVPHWSLVLILGSIGVLSWFPRRFTLRALLIATTLVAVVLGVIAWATK
jgi:hypothetical protein